MQAIPERFRRLGRHIDHDPRSRAFPAPTAVAVKSISHRRYCPPYDQGNLGSCTGNAMAGLLMTAPVYRKDWVLTEADAVRFYEWATAHDDYAGAWPPDDTGSSGLFVAKAAKAFGFISGYSHAFGLQHVLEALTLQPLIIGVNWYESMFYPSKTGRLRVAGAVAGGHEVELYGLSVARKTVMGWNSWGADWGKGGRFTLSWADLDRLLSENGDATTVTR